MKMKKLEGVMVLMRLRLLTEKAWMLPHSILLHFEVQKHGRYAPKQIREAPVQSVHTHL
jgi:hypothetical protein